MKHEDKTFYDFMEAIQELLFENQAEAGSDSDGFDTPAVDLRDLIRFMTSWKKAKEDSLSWQNLRYPEVFEGDYAWIAKLLGLDKSYSEVRKLLTSGTSENYKD